MGDQFFRTGGPSGFQYQNNSNLRRNNDFNDPARKQHDDKDLVIEENTVYEIDRDCYERLKRQKRHKIQEKK